jgi:hypothetical protein
MRLSGDSSLAQSLSLRTTLFAVLVLLFSLASLSSPGPLTPVAASNICICECCDGSSCLKDVNATFAIASCSTCTKAECTNRFAACVIYQDVNAKCINRDSIWNKATILIFLITLAALIILGCARNQSPYLQKLISTGNTGH